MTASCAGVLRLFSFGIVPPLQDHQGDYKANGRCPWLS
jgi:hypothetical protein